MLVVEPGTLVVAAFVGAEPEMLVGRLAVCLVAAGQELLVGTVMVQAWLLVAHLQAGVVRWLLEAAVAGHFVVLIAAASAVASLVGHNNIARASGRHTSYHKVAFLQARLQARLY
jgi:hypothetical protein